MAALGRHLSVYTSLVCSVRSCTHCSCVVLHSLAEVSSLQLASSLPAPKPGCQLCGSGGWCPPCLCHGPACAA